MDNNKVALLAVASTMCAFAVAALFQFVIHWGAPVIVTLCALTAMLSTSFLQGIASYITVPLRMVCFAFSIFCAVLFAGVFGFTGVLAAIYVVATIAANIIAGVTAR